MTFLLVALASLPMALLVWFLVKRLAESKAKEVGEEEVGRRIQQGYRVQTVGGLALLLGAGSGYLLGAALGAPEVGIFVGFGLAAVAAVTFGLIHDRRGQRQ